MKTLRFVPVLIFANAAAGVAPAAISLAEVFARIEQQHPTLAARAATERAVEALAAQAALAPVPTLDLGVENVLGTGRLQGVRSAELTVQATRTWERGGKREQRVAAATRTREGAAADTAAHRADLLAAGAAAYVAAAAAQQRATLARVPVQLARESATAIERRVQAGAASQAELARARAEVALAETESLRVESAAANARAALAATWGGGAPDQIAVPAALRLPATLPDEAALRARLDAHPRLAQQASSVAARRAMLAVEQSHAVPDLTAHGGLRLLREGTDLGFVAGVSVPLPSRSRNQGALRAAREHIAAAEHSARAAGLDLHAQFGAAWLALVASHRTAAALRRDALPAVEAAHEAVRRGHEAGQLTLLEVIESRRALGAVRADIAAAEATAAAALVRLDALTDRTFPLTHALFAAP
ncbi:MAG: TolC family protein [Opitutaceae bacterium]|nr:TolC family protein [Opitutaceae bacterium]